VSNAKSSPRLAHRSISCSISRPARIAAVSGANGARPAAIRSALMKRGTLASAGRNDCAKVVLPAPFGPAMMMTFLFDITVQRRRSSPPGQARGDDVGVLLLLPHPERRDKRLLRDAHIAILPHPRL